MPVYGRRLGRRDGPIPHEKAPRRRRTEGLLYSSKPTDKQSYLVVAAGTIPTFATESAVTTTGATATEATASRTTPTGATLRTTPTSSAFKATLTCGTGWALARFVYLEGAAFEVALVQRINRILRTIVFHFYEAKATGPASLAIRNQVHLQHGPIGIEQGLHILFRGSKRQIADVNVFHVGLCIIPARRWSRGTGITNLLRFFQKGNDLIYDTSQTPARRAQKK